MIFTPLEIPGSFRIDLERRSDPRGFFARSWCQDEFHRHGLVASLSQCNISYNDRKGTLRGMHFHRSLSREAKLVRCTQGAIFDVMIDLRRTSPTFQKWLGIELSPLNRAGLYIPEGCAHGFLSLQDCTEVFYQMSSPYEPDQSAGIVWNDPDLAIKWPISNPPLLSEKDSALPRFGSLFP